MYRYNVLASATRRAPGTRSNRFHSDYKLRSRLLALCSGLGDAAAGAGTPGGGAGGGVGGGGGSGAVGPPTSVLGLSISGGEVYASENAGSVHFEFYSPGGADDFLGDLGPPGSRVISAQNLHLNGLSDHTTLEQLAGESKVPLDLRFSLFARVRWGLYSC